MNSVGNPSSPLDTICAAAEHLCPEIELRVYWICSTTPIAPAECPHGAYRRQGDVIEVTLSPTLPVYQACHALAHWIAHGIIGSGHDHGAIFQQVLHLLHTEHDRMVDERQEREMANRE